MEFPPEHYFQAGTQRIRQAQHLYEEGASFALAIYVGGLAVECLLRAYKGRRDPTFDERHDPAPLFKASGMLDIDHDKLRAKHWTDEQIESHLAALLRGLGQGAGHFIDEDGGSDEFMDLPLVFIAQLDGLRRQQARNYPADRDGGSRTYFMRRHRREATPRTGHRP